MARHDGQARYMIIGFFSISNQHKIQISYIVKIVADLLEKTS